MNAPKFPAGYKVRVLWTAPSGKRHMSSCWPNQLKTLLDKRVRAGSTEIVAVCENGKRRVDLGAKP